MKKVKIELDATRNIFTYYIEVIIRFFAVPIDLFKIYFNKFQIKKTSIFYNLVNYPLSDYLFKKVIHAAVVVGLFFIGLLVFEFDERSIIIACSLIGLILYFPSFLKFMFIFLVMFTEFMFRLTKVTFFTLKSLFTEQDYF
ncbi:hypothetical protein A2422_01385 [Candidatus Woesebacteria bacterium RIFOXYC1_FULL_31_51]|uniref:Uncharacterized protein n=1 Tax=Candidatus Woesebacteria bacterium GW2011_GWC2_31_9 TaxID=1618586 RepID=A0A0F9YJR7_9BACT|nr:MAG: hypothetical protein UR17_C0001G0729 [Candidatus Woesebacteria bacterium GW2011_GWF1_31_35]KKP22664.1 MAG: hypothetical protein UR11_C0002G0044 [Candidatus Woesebacteria bacterium GW2011_GWC1_30_29]KKP25953.1 MAG: hypothetical protein UR13_C0006G0092 [Candidatus Woesebacteria bacterium GW2011_GWD1_31_12]KKP27179.1 MAG: hypothetical protein UR16_C0006G0068 [Candidatus Woesebacteria bacterium GW2011_GWB1_31_29]KKP31558.1 MAG: hypothetical protein UR21_C0008G0035 [Candidatus Woesebacteria 